MLQESIQKFDVPYETGYDSEDTYECWEYVHFQMRSEHIIVIPWSMPDLSAGQYNLFLTMKSLLVSELNKDNVLFGRKPTRSSDLALWHRTRVASGSKKHGASALNMVCLKNTNFHPHS